MAQMKKGVWVAVVLVIAALVAAAKFMMPKSSEEDTAKKQGTTDMVPTPAVNTNPAPALTLEDTMVPPSMANTKELTVKRSYANPSGSDEVGFTLVVDAVGVITDAKTEILATNDISKKRQEAFAAGLPAAVKGKKLSELSSIDRVGGSSLTTESFNAALAELKAKL